MTSINPKSEELDEDSKRSKSYPCPKCDQVFQSMPGLKYHRKSAHGKRQFSCSDCQKTFTSKPKLAKHNCHGQQDKENANPSEDNFQCEQCPKAFGTKNRLNAHVARNHSNIFHDCGTCGKRFKRKDHLHKHQKSVQCAK